MASTEAHAVTTNPQDKPSRPDTLRPGTRVGRWRVVEPLGVGGQGAVYRVEDIDHPGDFHALKLALHVQDARAEREVVLMMTRAAHPHVVRIHGFARWPHPSEGRLGVVMDWVPGLALDKWAEREGTTFRELCRASITVSCTLGELHARGVLHRDLKPEHILIRASDGQPVLLDFGVGWYEGASPLTTGPLPPATAYLLSPEAVRFLWKSPERPGARYAFQPTDDLYALGVCLYRATTGHYPFFEWMPRDILQSVIVHEVPPEPMRVNPRVPRALNDIIVRLLAKDPQERYPSGEALEAALVAAVADGETSWDAAVFAWDAAEKEIVRPDKPRPSEYKTVLAVRSRTHGRRWPARLALAAAGLLFLVPGPRSLPVAPEAALPETEWETDVHVDPDAIASEQMPTPLKEQKRAPCTEGLEVELSRACWQALEKRQPICPRLTMAYKGKCYLPVLKARPVPTSVDGGMPDAR